MHSRAPRRSPHANIGGYLPCTPEYKNFRGSLHIWPPRGASPSTTRESSGTTPNSTQAERARAALMGLVLLSGQRVVRLLFKPYADHVGIIYEGQFVGDEVEGGANGRDVCLK